MALLEALRERMERSADAEATYRSYVMNFLRSEYVGLKGYVVMDEATRYEIDFPLLGASTGRDDQPKVQKWTRDKNGKPVPVQASP
jgi:hypothetical protein